MGTVDIKRIRFSVLELLGKEDLIPNVQSFKDLMGTNLYHPDSTCPKCYPTTSYCRGHLGKIALGCEHVFYPYRRRVEQLLKVVCGTCYLPVRESLSPTKPSERAKYLGLCERYDGATCMCTGVQEAQRGYGQVQKVKAVYSAIEARGVESVLPSVFGLPNQRGSVLKSHVLALPIAMLSQLPGPSGVLAAYRKLLDTRGLSSNPDEILKSVAKLYKEYSLILRDKPGMIRQLVVPRRLGNSVRAVIVGDPYLGVAELGLPRAISDKMSSDLLVSVANFQRCIDLIRQGRVTHIAYDRQRFKLATRRVHLVVILKGHRTEVPLGSTVECYDGERDVPVVHQAHNTYSLCNTLRESERVKLPGPAGSDPIDSGAIEQRCTMLYVDAVPRGHTTPQRVPLQHWCILRSGLEDHKLLVHRNPVLSAGSIHTHAATFLDTSTHVSMSLEERQHQREHLLDRLGRLEVTRESSLGLKPSRGSTHRAEWSHDLTAGFPVCKITSVATRVVAQGPSVNCSISLNPVATTTYQADFDGDEVNVARIDLAGKSSRDISILCDLLKGSVGPTHDGRYGLYSLVTDEIGLSHIRADYSQVILASMTSEDRASSQKLLDIGLSRYQSRLVTRDLKVSVSKGTLATFLRDETRHEYLGPHTKCVMDFVSYLRLLPSRKSLMDSVLYNTCVLEYLSKDDNMEAVMLEYEHMDKMDAVSRFYSDVTLYLYYVCDYCGISYDRLSGTVSKGLIESKSRPTKGTISSMYNSVGFTSYPVPGGIRVSHVRSNFSRGVSPREFDSLCHSARAQVVRKAETTAPEGDSMRLQCNYMSTTSKHKGVWREGDRVLYEDVTQESLRDLRSRVSAATKRGYSDVLLESSERLEYQPFDSLSRELKEHRKNVVHIGQRKLLMCEIDFLTDYSGERCLVVYGGAAPGGHISALLKLFPHVSFHLYDTEDLSSNLYDKVTNKLRKGLKDCNAYIDGPLLSKRYGASNKRVLFISDIRTNTNPATGGKPTDSDVSRDNALNVQAVFGMNPFASMLKFRLPYAHGASDLLDGELRIQCWPGKESTEVRLVSTRPYRSKTYDHTDHEQKMFRHNVVRPLPIPGKRSNNHLLRLMGEKGIKPHYDMYRETGIIDKYVRRYRCDESYVYRAIAESLGTDVGYYLEREKA